MQRFLDRHQEHIVGVLSGFDRVLFKGSLMSMAYLNGLDRFLTAHGVLYKDYAGFVQRVSNRLKQHAEAFCEREGRPMVYLASSVDRKEDKAREIAERDGVEQGLICVLSCVEPCQTFSVQRCRLRKQLELVAQTRKCLHLYFYFMDREFGLMHIRLQTWLPMMVQVCINGREWLARALDRAGVAYVKDGNCFTQIDDVATAQRLLDQLTAKNWTSFLNALARRVNPWLAKRSGLSLRSYYWTMRETEYATDVMFRDARALSTIYPSLVDHALRHFHCKDALRFLGRRTNSRFRGEVTGDIKHWVEENSIKMYDKKGSVLRIETTINNPRRFKVRRRATRNG